MLPINKAVMHRFIKVVEARFESAPVMNRSSCASQHTGRRVVGWYEPWSSQIREL
jgi:hypothetical protein